MWLAWVCSEGACHNVESTVLIITAILETINRAKFANFALSAADCGVLSSPYPYEGL